MQSVLADIFLLACPSQVCAVAAAPESRRSRPCQLGSTKRASRPPRPGTIPESSSGRRGPFRRRCKSRTSDGELLSANVAEEWENPTGRRVRGSLPARRRSLPVANCASPGEARRWSEERSVLRKAGKLLTELTGSTKKLNLAEKVQYLG